MLFSQFLKYQPQVFAMFFCGTGKYQDVVNKDDHEVIKIFMEDVLYQMHELRRGVGNTKRHHQKIRTIPNAFEMRS